MEQTDIFERIYKPLNNPETDNYLFETDVDLTLIDENKILEIMKLLDKEKSEGEKNAKISTFNCSSFWSSF